MGFLKGVTIRPPGRDGPKEKILWGGGRTKIQRLTPRKLKMTHAHPIRERVGWAKLCYDMLVEKLNFLTSWAIFDILENTI